MSNPDTGTPGPAGFDRRGFFVSHRNLGQPLPTGIPFVVLNSLRCDPARLLR